jgi:glycosyltransferase involved in cell wall biosynthesis
MRKKILFVSHEASRTGAPMILIHLLTWIKSNTDLKFNILLLKGGELTSDFENLSKVYHWDLINLDSIKRYKKNNTFNYFILIFNFLFKKFFGHTLFQKLILLKLSYSSYDLIYLNSVVSTQMIPLLNKKNPKIISHIHELSYLINNHFKEYVINKNYLVVDLYIAASNAVYNNLINYGIQPNKIITIHEFLPININKKTIGKQQIKDSLSIGDEYFIIGGSGQMQIRKGVDLFIQISWLVQKKMPSAKIKFVWVGESNYDIVQYYYYETLLQQLKCNLHFTDIQDNPQNYFQIFDLFLLTSREDPFPIVCLEAANESIPIVCFEGAGGMTEFTDQGCGFKVPYHDLEQMSNTILELYQDRKLLNNIGQNAKLKVRQYDVNIAAPLIYSEIQKLLKFN